MDRKYCIFLYSKYSKPCVDIISYIKNLPFDFLNITGMTMICVDNDEIKPILKKNQIEIVPTLLVEYFNGEKHKFENHMIYMWINKLIESIPKIHIPETSQSHVKSNYKTQVPSFISTLPDIEEDEKKEEETFKIPNKKDITSLAIEMQKNRDKDINKLKL